jgi:hypothetical protein
VSIPDPTRPTGPDREPTRAPETGESPWGLPPESGATDWHPVPARPATPTAPATPYRPPPSYGGPPPRKGGAGPVLVVALVATAIVLITGLVTGGVLLARSGDDERAGGGDPTREPTASAPTSTEPTSVEPTSEPPVEPTPSEPPETDPPAVPASGPFKYQEFGGDWKFRFGGVSLFATFRTGWNYRTCAPVEASAGSLSRLGCRRAASWTYRALENNLALTHVVMTFRNPRAAKRAADGGLTAEDWKVDPLGFLEGVENGTWEAEAQGTYVVLTLESHQRPVRKAKADEFRSYGNSDISAALIFRG